MAVQFCSDIETIVGLDRAIGTILPLWHAVCDATTLERNVVPLFTSSTLSIEDLIVAISSVEQNSSRSADDRALQTQDACDERSRIVVAVRALENALAAASWGRESSWTEKVQSALNLLQTALQETRDSADSSDSLLSMVIEEAPRLEVRVKRLQEQYQDLERHIESLIAQLKSPSAEALKENVDDLRQRIGWLITALQHTQSKETELLYETFQVDIGQCD